MSITITTDHTDAAAILARIETARGKWLSYGGDGRLTTDPDEAHGSRVEPDGTGWRARDSQNPHGTPYGWGPLAKSERDAVVLLLAQMVATLEQHDA